MNRWFRLAAVLIAVVTFGFAIVHAQDEDVLSGEDLDALIAAAEAEGQVVVYSFTSRISRIETAFEAMYPGIDVVAFDISSTEQIARIRAELEAGVSAVDVVYISDAPVVFGSLVQDGLVERFVPPQFADRVPEEFQVPLLANRISSKVLMYNEAAHPDGAPVSNLWELTQPEWNGRVIMVDPLIRGDYLDLMVEIVLRSDEMAAAYEELYGQPIELGDGIENAGEQWIADLFANGVILVDDTDTVNEAIGLIGQENPPIGFSTYSDRRDNEEEGWALQLANDVVPSPGIAFPALLGIVRDAQHPAAARLLIHFMMGDDSPTGGSGYAPFYVPGDYATRTDIEPHPDAVPLEEFNAWRINPEATFEIRQEVADFILVLQ
ncbi:ABC transporter substrate-binding protein [Kamptonema cortianum]|nr:ABC transporter substrate-binding protein [Kamptonema cortianum]MDL5054948.1 ABC transporter substrate-binding protein [Oscillatoria laete-virens NRMC-F 0139]